MGVISHMLRSSLDVACMKWGLHIYLEAAGFAVPFSLVIHS